MTQPRKDAVTAQLRGLWALTAVINYYGNPLARAKVVAEFDGPVHAMGTLGAVIAAFGAAGAPVSFRSVTITAAGTTTPITTADLERD